MLAGLSARCILMARSLAHEREERDVVEKKGYIQLRSPAEYVVGDFSVSSQLHRAHASGRNKCDWDDHSSSNRPASAFSRPLPSCVASYILIADKGSTGDVVSGDASLDAFAVGVHRSVPD